MAISYNDNETPVEDDDVEGHGVTLNVNETDEDDDVEGHGVSLNVNESASADDE